ncbi:MAG: metal-dependent hydrolase [Cypionkella sp.]
MDNLTHSLVGALLGQAGLKRKTGLAMPALIIGANIPDIDAACFLWLDGVQHLGFRRGITHGPIAWVVLPLLLASGLMWFDRWQAGRGKRPEGRLPVHFGWLYALSFLATLTHPALDWLNVYGIRLLEPFSSRWFYGDTLFIIDVWLWALLGFACVFSLRREKRDGEWMRPARIAIAVGLAYVAHNATITRSHERMTSLDAVGPTIASPVPFAFWEREMIIPIQNGRYRVIPNFSGPTSERLNTLTLGDPGLSYFCVLDQLATVNSHTRAFLFWSRSPVVDRAPDGSVLLRDARFYDPRARDRFTVALPDVRCEPL